MFDLEKVIECFYVLLGEREGEEKLVRQLGNAAIEQVKSGLKYGDLPAEGEHNLLMLCVALTYYQYALISAQHQMQSVKVGALSVGLEGGKLIESAKQLKDYYSRATRKYMKAKFVEFRNI